MFFGYPWRLKSTKQINSRSVRNPGQDSFRPVTENTNWCRLNGIGTLNKDFSQYSSSLSSFKRMRNLGNSKCENNFFIPFMGAFGMCHLPVPSHPSNGDCHNQHKYDNNPQMGHLRVLKTANKNHWTGKCTHNVQFCSLSSWPDISSASIILSLYPVLSLLCILWAVVVVVVVWRRHIMILVKCLTLPTFMDWRTLRSESEEDSDDSGDGRIIVIIELICYVSITLSGD